MKRLFIFIIDFILILSQNTLAQKTISLANLDWI